MESQRKDHFRLRALEVALTTSATSLNGQVKASYNLDDVLKDADRVYNWLASDDADRPNSSVNLDDLEAQFGPDPSIHGTPQ